MGSWKDRQVRRPQFRARVVLAWVAVVLQQTRTCAFQSVFCSDCGDHGQSRSQRSRDALVIECDLHGNSLHDLCEIAGRIIWWQERELGTAGGRNLNYPALEDFVWVLV